MKTATVTQFRSKMKEHLRDVLDHQDILILSGPKNKDFVVLSLEQYNAMEETAHLLSTPANTEHLMKSIAQDKAGKVAYKFLLTEGKMVPAKKKTLVAAKVRKRISLTRKSK